MYLQIVPDKIIEKLVEVITVESNTATSVLLMCQENDIIYTLYMPKEIAEDLWQTSTSAGILAALEQQQMYKFRVQSSNIIGLSTDSRPQNKGKPATATATSTASSKHKPTPKKTVQIIDFTFLVPYSPR